MAYNDVAIGASAQQIEDVANYGIMSLPQNLEPEQEETARQNINAMIHFLLEQGLTFEKDSEGNNILKLKISDDFEFNDNDELITSDNLIYNLKRKAYVAGEGIDIVDRGVESPDVICLTRYTYEKINEVLKGSLPIEVIDVGVDENGFPIKLIKMDDYYYEKLQREYLGSEGIDVIYETDENGNNTGLVFIKLKINDTLGFSENEESGELELGVNANVIATKEELNAKADKEGKWELVQSVEVSEDEISSVVFNNFSGYKKIRLIAKIGTGSTSSSVTCVAKFPNNVTFVNAYLSGGISTSKVTTYQLQLEKENGKWQGWFSSTTAEIAGDKLGNPKNILNDKAFSEEYYETDFASLTFKSANSDVYLPIGTIVELRGVK